MKKFFLLFIVMILVTSCASGVKEGVDTKVNEFITEYNGTFALFPTYEYMGERETESDGAYRTYHLWKEKSSGKYIMIQVLNPKSGVFPKNINWIDFESGFYYDDVIIVYDKLHRRSSKIMESFGEYPLPACYLVTQKFTIDDQRKEAVYLVHIVPDGSCLRTGPKATEEFKRVILTR